MEGKINLDAELYSLQPIPFQTVKLFLTKTLPELGWGQSNEEETLFDAGCGPGGTTTKLILPLFPRLKKCFAVDILPGMIDSAKKHNFDPKIEYSVANLADWSSLEHFENQITKFVSVYCFHWLKDPRKGFENAFRLLKPGGEAAITCVLESSYYSTLIEMHNNPEWTNLFQNVDYVPTFQKYKHDGASCKKMAEDIGFEVLHCKDEKKTNVFRSDKERKDFFWSICVLRPYIHSDRKKAFEQEFLEVLDKLNDIKDASLLLQKDKILEIVIKKPEF
ncbi:UNVERIFIED_CONTAM: jhamt [Trichonephila clavipes]